MSDFRQRWGGDGFSQFLSMLTSLVDVALNTQQAHEDYVGIICTKAVRAFLFS